MLCRADSIGVFQVESRAQIGTLPRLQPRRVLRPGDRDRADPARPDPGRRGAPLHPPGHRPGGGHLPAPGAEAGAGADPGRAAVPGAADADRHRGRRLHRRRRRPAAPGDGLQARGGEDRAAEGEAVRRDGRRTASPASWPTTIYARIQAFANFGFAESHAISFALLVYASSWLKLHYPGAFLAGLLRAQPMGFYSPQSLVADARRHGVRGAAAPTSPSPGWTPTWSTAGLSVEGRSGADGSHPAGMRAACRTADQPPVGPFRRSAPDRTRGAPAGRRLRGPARADRGARDRPDARRADRRRAGAAAVTPT